MKTDKELLKHRLLTKEAQFAATAGALDLIDRNLEVILKKEQMEAAKQSFKNFFQQAWDYIEPGNPFLDNWHIDLVCEALEALFRGEIENLILMIPPRCAKSSIACVSFPAWVWLHDPTEKFITSSFSANLATRDCTRARHLMQTPWYRSLDPPFEFSKDVNQKTYYENTVGGYRYSTSVGGAVTGFGYTISICDDPLEAKKSTSKAYINSVLEWWTQSMSTRGNPGCRQVLMHQRLHEKDPIGYELENNPSFWEVISLPMEYDPDHPHLKYWDLNQIDYKTKDPRTQKGEILWPAIYPPKVLEQRKQKLGPYGVAAQFQQNPVPLGGGIIKRDWIRYYNSAYNFDFLIGSCDLTFGDTGGSYNVGQVWGKKGADLYLINQYRNKLDVVGQIQMLRQMKREYPAIRAILVEKMANGEAVTRLLQNEIQGIIPVSIAEIGGGDKEVRLSLAAFSFEAGNIFFPNPTTHNWVIDLVEELTKFPKCENDDQVDCCSMLINWLAGKKNFTTIGVFDTKAKITENFEKKAQASPFGACASIAELKSIF